MFTFTIMRVDTPAISFSVTNDWPAVFDRLFHFDFALVDFDAVLLFQRFGDLIVRDCAVELAVFASAHGQLNDLALELARTFLRLRAANVLADACRRSSISRLR